MNKEYLNRNNEKEGSLLKTYDLCVCKGTALEPLRVRFEVVVVVGRFSPRLLF
jgi:hypothetical protein